MAKKLKTTKQLVAKTAKAKAIKNKKPIATHATQKPVKKTKLNVTTAKPTKKYRTTKTVVATKKYIKTKPRTKIVSTENKPDKVVKRNSASAKPSKKLRVTKHPIVAKKQIKTKTKPAKRPGTAHTSQNNSKRSYISVVFAKYCKTLFKRINRKWAGIVLGATISTTYLVALHAVLQINLLPTKYLQVAVPVSVLIIIGLVFSVVRHKWQSALKSIVLGAICLLVLLANGFVYSICTSTNNFLATIQGGDYTLESYSIVTKKDYAVTLKSGKSVGYLVDDVNNSLVLETISNKTTADHEAYKELASLTVGLDGRSTDMVLLRSSLLSLLEKNYPDFYEKLSILDTFNVRVKNASSTKKIDISRPYAIYIGGVDSYGDIESVSRNDVNIVAVINPKTRKVLLINTPRDYYVQLHGTTGTRDKLTHAGIYGRDMSRQTLEDLYGVPIDYNVRINFTSMMKIVDSIGGVNVYSDNTFNSWTYTFIKGYNQMDGEEALEFSRNRKAFEGGDRTRGQNQQRVIEAIISKVNDPRSLLQYQTIVRSLGESFQTNATKQELAALLRQQMNTLGSWQTESISADGTDSHNVTYSTGSLQLYVMEPNTESLSATRAKMKSYMR